MWKKYREKKSEGRKNTNTISKKKFPRAYSIWRKIRDSNNYNNSNRSLLTSEGGEIERVGKLFERTWIMIAHGKRRENMLKINGKETLKKRGKTKCKNRKNATKKTLKAAPGNDKTSPDE